MGLLPRLRSAGIFISYRHQDAPFQARAIYEHLEKSFGKWIFHDVARLAPGEHIRRALEESLQRSKVMLVVIGPGWLDATDKKGKRRLDQPGDWVRLEILLALRMNVQIIPILVGGAKPLQGHELPPDIAEIAQLNAIEITHHTFDLQMEELVAELERLTESRRLLVAGALCAVLAAVNVCPGEIVDSDADLGQGDFTLPEQEIRCTAGAAWKVFVHVREGTEPTVTLANIEKVLTDKDCTLLPGSKSSTDVGKAGVYYREETMKPHADEVQQIIEAELGILLEVIQERTRARSEVHVEVTAP